jgi:6-phosphogluconolactonase
MRMSLFSSTRSRAGAFAVSALAAVSLLGATSSLASADDGAVFTQTNSAAGNAVLAFDRAADGHLTPAGSFATGGLGSGTSLGSQGPVAARSDTVYAVDAGSGDIAALRVTRHGLRPFDRDPAGIQPISLTVHGSLLYALDAGGSGQILGYRVRPGGDLKPINRSARPLSAGASAPAQVSFSPDGRFLAVTEKNTNRIDTYRVLPDGRVIGPVVNASAGATPFGFAFDPAGRLIVSEAGASTASSYALARNGTLATISSQIPTLEGAACWVAVTPDGRFAYTGNGGGSVTAFAVSARGELTRLQSFSSPGANEVAISPDGAHLYVENPGPGMISAFSIGGDGLLTALPAVTGLPSGLAGIAAS